MSDTVTLTLPVEAPYRALSSELARKFIELAGGSEADARAGAEATAEAVSRATGGPKAAGDMVIALAVEADRVAIRVRCGGESAEVTQPVPART